MSLSNWQGFGQEFLGLAVERGAGSLYVHQTWKRVPKAAAAAAGGDKDDGAATGSNMDTSDDTVREEKHGYYHTTAVPRVSWCGGEREGGEERCVK